MNKVVLMGRLTRDPDIRYSQGDQSMAIARFTLAVDRRRGRNNQNGDQQTADFISCVSFGKQAEFAEKYYHKGIKICISGRIQTGSYTRQDGTKVYTTDVVVEEQEFAESRNAQSQGADYSNYTSAAPNRSYSSPAGNGNRYSAPASAAGSAPALASETPAAPSSAQSSQNPDNGSGTSDAIDGFMNIPDGIDEELPFN